MVNISASVNLSALAKYFLNYVWAVIICIILVFLKAFVGFDEDGFRHGKRTMSSILISHSLPLSPAVSYFSVELFLWVQHAFWDNRRSMETFEPSGSSLSMSQCPRAVAELICFHVTLSVRCTDIVSLLPWSLTLGKKNINWVWLMWLAEAWGKSVIDSIICNNHMCKRCVHKTAL